ncbi:uncharacterized protein At5g41620-like isoform X2 [Chenopodium quinoa]|uniref:uncharacterized protein At5g41620-like isoform X2 n=1 Tax=Chenopodium quinoa TaxID=63459 RepID=UPI000B77E708|nr:uncharacterized protein At5g41620-like isoform X2 [Chenopodium quinoa]
MKIREEEESGEKGTISAEKKDEFFSRRRKSLPLLAACKRGFCGPRNSTVTTPVILWKEVVVVGAQNTIIKGNNKNNTFPLFSSFSFSCYSSAAAQFSARKLGSVFWEFQHYFNSEEMYLGVNNHNQRGRRIHHRLNKDEGFDHNLHQINGHPSLPVDPHRGGSSDYQPSSAGSLRRHIAASLMRHHQSSERNKHALQPLSPASYGSSLEMAPYNPAATPDSSIELRGRMGEPNYGFKTSTELLKVLNRIWTLEEQHASNVSLVKALKHELDHARGRIKELLRDQQANRHEIDELLKQISQDNISRKSKEQERVEAALQSVRDELEDERKLRKRSESLHRKLARELFEIKVALSTTLKELEKERTSGELLEELCDEFAKTIREYAKQVHDVKQKSDRDWTGHTSHDNLILHISESWLDERAQRRDREAQRASAVVDKLRPEIETFLTARQTANIDTKETDHKESRLRHRSLESIPEVGNAPEDSAAYSDSRCAEKSKVGPSHYEEQEELALNGRRKGQSPPSVQMSEPQNTREIDSRMKTGEGTPTEISMLQKSEIYDSYQKKKNYDEEGHGSNSKTVDKLISELLLSEGGSFPPEYEYKEAASSNPSTLKRHASPVRQWMTNMRSPDPKISESSSRLQSVRENSLKAKLQEPKSKGQRSRLKILKGSTP